jgi:hypothetical protein
MSVREQCHSIEKYPVSAVEQFGDGGGSTPSASANKDKVS